VNAGELIINGSLGGPALTVNSGGTLAGTGSANGPVTIASNGTLAPGESGPGQFTVAGNLTLQSGSRAAIELDKSIATNDQLLVGGTLNYGGTLLVTNLGGTLVPGDSFVLSSAASWSGNFTAISNAPGLLGPQMIWNFNPTNGTLSVVQTVAMNPTNLTFTVASNALVLSWPADHTGWRLQVQTNALAVGLASNWTEVAGSTGTNQVSLGITPATGTVFYRLASP
jgi:uncharacterized protein with beta-barrel porin domain